MLRITIELVLHGNEQHAEVLHTGLIANDGTGTKSVGHYRYRFNARGTARSWKRGSVRDFPRTRSSAWQLLLACLRNATGH